MLRAVIACPLFGGGVCGNVKLNALIKTDAPAAMRKGTCEASIPIWPITTPIAIQPSVANTRINGKSRPGSFMWASVKELVRETVGK